MHVAQNYLFNSASERDVRTLLRVFELNLKNPSFTQQRTKIFVCIMQTDNSWILKA